EPAESWCKRSALPLKFRKFRWRTDFRCELEVLTIYAPKNAKLGFADARGVLEHGLKDRLQLAGRRANDIKHLGGRRLLLQRLCQFAWALLLPLKQSHVLDRDYCLVGESGY